MNVLYFVNRFPKLSESFVINEIHELEQRGYNVAVFSLREPEIDMTHDEVSDLEAEVGYLPEPSIKTLLSAPGRWCFDPDVLRSAMHTSHPLQHAGVSFITGHCVNFIESLDFEIEHIHGHFLNWPKLAAQYVAERYGCPCTTTAHAYDLYSEPDLEMVRRLAERMDRVVTISEYNRQYLSEEVGTDTPVEVVRMGVNPDKFSPTESTRRNRIVTIARFVEKKGIIDAISAISDVVTEESDLEYHIIGSGPEESQIQREIRRAGVEDHVKILGNVTDERLLQELDEAELFLLPCVIADDGDRDGIPVVLMEAMAMETVPVSTTVSGIPELIQDGTNGILVEPREPDQLCDAISSLLTNRGQIAQMSTAARERIISEYTVSQQAASMDRIFTEFSEGS